MRHKKCEIATSSKTVVCKIINYNTVTLNIIEHAQDDTSSFSIPVIKKLTRINVTFLLIDYNNK